MFTIACDRDFATVCRVKQLEYHSCWFNHKKYGKKSEMIHHALVFSTFTRNLKQIVEVDEQKTLSLECETSHSVSTRWFHNGKEISGMDHREIIQEGRLHRLVISRTTVLDAGIYKCTVKNQTTESKVVVKGTNISSVKIN